MIGNQLDDEPNLYEWEMILDPKIHGKNDSYGTPPKRNMVMEKLPCMKMYFPLKIVIFHRYVTLLEGYSGTDCKVQQFRDPKNLKPWTLMAKVWFCSTNLLYGTTPESLKLTPSTLNRYIPTGWLMADGI